MSPSSRRGDGPHAAFLDAADDRVIRLVLPDGGAHDCTIGEASTLGIDLAGATATAVRTAAGHRRLPGNVVVSITVGFESMRLIDGAATVHVVMPPAVNYQQAEEIAARHVAELRREAKALPAASTPDEPSEAEPRTLGDLTADDVGEWITVNGWHGQVARLEHLSGLAGKKWTCVLLIHVDRPSGDSAFVSNDSTTPLDPSEARR